MSITVLPGDVLVTRSKKGVFGRLIRAGTDSAWNHVAIASHTDAAGTFWGIEGRPGGVGWVDLARYLDDPWSLTNAPQPREDAQRALIVAAAQHLLGTEYDWVAILGDAGRALAPHLALLWKPPPLQTPPAHVVCSTLADWVYFSVGLRCPNKGWCTTPADWADWIVARRWAA